MHFPSGVPYCWAIFSARYCDPVPENIFTELCISSAIGAAKIKLHYRNKNLYERFDALFTRTYCLHSRLKKLFTNRGKHGLFSRCAYLGDRLIMRLFWVECVKNRRADKN